MCKCLINDAVYYFRSSHGSQLCSFFFFFNDTATTEIYTLSLHDALPICIVSIYDISSRAGLQWYTMELVPGRSEEHTSELQSQSNLVCRLLLEKKKIKILSQFHARSTSISIH